MPMVSEMDEYVNWNYAGAAVDPSFDMSEQDLNYDPNQSIDLALENVNDDDFGFFALQHFSGDSALSAGLTDGPAFELPDRNLSPQECWETPEAPCANCSIGGYQCKLIREGKYKGYCTSCVALGHECSLGGYVSGSLLESSTLPHTPWPIQGHHPNTIPHEDLLDSSRSSSTPDLAGMTAISGGQTPAQTSNGPAKIGARFSRESIRILKQWLSAHSRHPYPSDEEKEMLQRQTGLNKTQITNWLANARRRGKVIQPRSTSPHIKAWAGGIDIPARKATPAAEDMNPLQRWVDSPPEHEPASAIAIARAVSASTSAVSSGQDSPFSHNYTDDGSGRSLQDSSADSIGTSHSSGGSFASAYSHASRGSFGSLGSLNRGRRRRRRRNAAKQPEEPTLLTPALKTYQCTFCTETFKTKHDWQRHEKSLHLSLERWVCCPNGPSALRPETNIVSCVFCGLANPDAAHEESHNYSTCQDKSLAERTFYRKDHLNQHLRLVHNVKFVDWSMKSWKVATPEIRSRCGFCGIVMDTWTIRVEHLAEHFKRGYSMADWKGDWGFEAPVLDLVENSIPPYLIHSERLSPLPYVANQSPPESPRNAYELIKLELAYYMAHRPTDDDGPTDDQLQVEACRIIFASEVLSLQGISSMSSWLRDLIMSSEPLTRQAKFGPLRGQAENRLAVLKINGKDNLFEACPLENRLHEFVKDRRLLGLTAMDDELQAEACRIVGRMEEISTNPSDAVANWLVRMINSSTSWLMCFRQRAHLPRSEDVADSRLRSKDPNTIDSTVYNYSRLERELGEYLDCRRSLGIDPTDADLQRQARIIIYDLDDDGWNQTAADSSEWLAAFKRRHSRGLSPTNTSSGNLDRNSQLTSPSDGSLASANAIACSFVQSGGKPTAEERAALNTSPFFLNDANCYRRLAKELSRFVASTTSPNNPNQHVPTDEELQHQARWILYDDDDPWNQTAADNAEWLQRFKRDVGIAKEDGPGLPSGDSWSIHQGGTGFEPPYVYPRASLAAFNESVPAPLGQGPKPFEAEPALANKFFETLTARYPKPAAVFCSRELEHGLAEFVQHQVADTGVFPSDTSLRKKATEILDTESTAADDAGLLDKFKAMMREKLPPGWGATMAESPQNPVSALPEGVGLNISDEEMNDILKDMSFDFAMTDESTGL